MQGRASWPVGSSPTVTVAPRRLLKTLDQAAGHLPWLPISTKKACQLGTAPLPASLFPAACGWAEVGDREGCEGRQCMGLANGHGKQPGPGLLVLGRTVTAAFVQTQPGPANVQGDPKRHPGPRLLQNKHLVGRGRAMLETLGHPYLLIMPLFRHTAQFWFGAYVLVVEYF